MVLSARERQWLKTLYHGEVELVDDAIGTILKSLKRLGIYEDCLLAFTSDHGEEFFEHGGFEHGHTLYQEVLRVPLVVKPPRSWNIPPTHIQAPVSTQRTMPTILDFCGIKTNSEEMTCPSLLGYVRGANGQVSDLPVFSAGTLFYTERQAFITNGVKYIEDRISGRMELYDLKGDPEEKRSLAEALPEASAIAGKALADYREKMMAHRAKLGILAEKASLDQGALRELRSLGYVK